MAQGSENGVPNFPILYISTLGVFVYFCLILFTSVWIIHQAPESQFPELTVETSTLADLAERGVSPGFTYGDMSISFIAQINPRLIITVLFFSGLLSVIFYLSLLKHNITKSGAKWWVSLFNGATFGLLYAVLFLTFLSSLPKLNYITSSGETLSVGTGLFQASVTFFALIMLHSVMVACVTVVWSRPILPETVITKFRFQNNVDILEYHIEHWMQYYSWIIATLGGTLATVSVLYVIEIRQFQITFLLHIAFLIGGAMAIIFLFVIYKIIVYESIISYN